MMNDVKSNGGDIWILSDLHLLKRGKDTPRIVSNDVCYNNLKEVTKMVSEKDMLIFLGDLLDDTIPRKIAVAELVAFSKLFGKNKIWVRGNNDMFSDKLLRNNGWDVCYAAMTEYNGRKIVFSHTSLEVYNVDAYNVHGHMHRNDNNTMYYYHNPKKCINLAPITSKGYAVNIESIDQMIDSKEWVKNQSAWDGEEKPGMSRYIYEQAIDEMNDDLFGGDKID